MFSPPRILIADDEEFSSDATAEWLRQEGYICDEAHNVDAAITALATQPYALLICQLTTPGNQGLKFLRALRHNDHPVPVMVVTGHPSIQTAVGALRLSAHSLSSSRNPPQ